MNTLTTVRRHWRILLTAAGFVPTAGCGLLLTSGPPANHASLNYFSCSESRVGPGLDFLSAGYNALTGVATGHGAGATLTTSARVEIFAGAALYVFSGVVGEKKVSKCHAAKQALADRVSAALTNR